MVVFAVMGSSTVDQTEPFASSGGPDRDRNHHSEALSRWLGQLSNNQHTALIEFSTLLLSTASFGNPLNHPGPPADLPLVAKNYHPAVVLLGQGVNRLLTLTRQLLGNLDRTFVFHQYVEGLLLEDTARANLTTQSHPPDSAQGSLLLLRRSFTNLVDVAEGLSQIDRVPHRYFNALLQLARTEVTRNPVFNPWQVSPINPHTDQGYNRLITDLLEKTPGSRTQRLLAFSFRSLYRLLAYLGLIEQMATTPSKDAAPALGRLYMVASLVSSEARTLTTRLTSKSGIALAASFDELVQNIPASEINTRFEHLRGLGIAFIDIRGSLESLASNLRLELRRFLVHDLPSMDEAVADPAVPASRFVEAARRLRPAIQNLILFLIHSVGGHLDSHDLFQEEDVRVELSSRLRSHVWMFIQIIRAFLAKATAAIHQENGWTSQDDFTFIFEFIRYFKSIAYPLLRDRDLASFRAYLRVLEQLSNASPITRESLQDAIGPSEAFYRRLSELFEQISKRQELQGIPFVKREAARSLKLYLGT